MSQHDKRSRMSYAGQEPSNPASLRQLRAIRLPFDHARDPCISAQLKDRAKTEAQRREESGQGSLMVQKHRPFPELRPKYETVPLKASFDRAWLKEQREARLSRFKEEHCKGKQNIEAQFDKPCMERK